MKKNICFGLVFLLLAGCSVHTNNHNNNVRREVVVMERPSPPPEWVDKTPEATSQYHYFVGLSDLAATEKKARNDAYKDSINKFATYCGVNVKILYNYLAVSHRLSSEMNDPVISSSEYQNHLVEAMVSRVKEEQWYTEKIKRFLGSTYIESAWKVWGLTKVPVDEVEKVKNYKPPEPLSIHIMALGGDQYSIEVRSHLGMPVENFRLLKNGCLIFPDTYCPTTNYNYRINNDTATLDFSSTGSILLGGGNDIFSFCLPESGTITVNYSIDNKHYSFSHKYGLSD